MKNTWQTRKEILYKGRDDKFVCLMDLALMAMQQIKARRASCRIRRNPMRSMPASIVVPVEIDGETEEWLVNFKNETHNHPTEIEPFGGAATCLGGAIRDPLSGRTYVYQAMRVTGAADPTVSVKETLKGKLPQKKLVRERSTRLQLLWQPDRPCDRLCKGDLSSELCGEAYGDRCSHGSSSALCRDPGKF